MRLGEHGSSGNSGGSANTFRSFRDEKFEMERGLSSAPVSQDEPKPEQEKPKPALYSEPRLFVQLGTPEHDQLVQDRKNMIRAPGATYLPSKPE